MAMWDGMGEVGIDVVERVWMQTSIYRRDTYGIIYFRGIHLWNLIHCKLTFCETLCSQALLLMKNEFGYVQWLGEEDYQVANEFSFWPPRQRNLVQMAASLCMCISIHADAHAQGVSPSFPLQLKTADACKKGRFGLYELLKVYYNVTTWLYRRINWFSHSIIHTIS